jgi:hypothetical protein
MAAGRHSLGMDTGTAQEQGRHDVISWRRAQLLYSGFPPRLASRIASDGGFDLHALIELTERGCPPALAVRILAPLKQGGAPA